jgi:hypothetical protein
MTARKKKSEEPEWVFIPVVDKLRLAKKLQALTQESGDIAEYIDDHIHYGRALGYAEGKKAAYGEIAKRVLDGEFDPDFTEEDDDGYEM